MFQKVIIGCALAASMLALAISMLTWRIVQQASQAIGAGKEQVVKTHGPILLVSRTVTSSDTTIGLRFDLANEGNEPAFIQNQGISHADVPISDIRALTAVFSHSRGRILFSGKTSLGRSLLPPEERISMMDLSIGPMQLRDDAWQQALQMQGAVCYCAADGRCWVANSGPGVPRSTPDCEQEPTAGQFFWSFRDADMED